MYQSFGIRNFKCFTEFEIDNLSSINLITGYNNIGKTALLEALFLHCGAYNPALTLRINAFRGISDYKIDLGWWAEKPWDSLFIHNDISRTIEFKGKDSITGDRWLWLRVLNKHENSRQKQFNTIDDNEETRNISISSTADMERVLELSYKVTNKPIKKHTLYIDTIGPHIKPANPQPPFPGYYLSTDSDLQSRDIIGRFGVVQKADKEYLIVDALNIIEPKLEKVEIIVSGGNPVLHGKIKNSIKLPLQFMGQGMVRLSDILIHILNANNGVLLIDEIDNGIHYSVQEKVWKAIGKLAHLYKAQIFATTHSRECVKAAHEAFRENDEVDFAMHRLERRKDAIKVVTYGKNKLEAAFETDMEIR